LFVTVYDNMYIESMNFTWDENKRCANLKKHQLDFADAEKVFSGAVRIFEDTRFDYGEQRWVSVGLLDLIVVVIIHTETETEIRIISMRKATNYEKENFRI
jgi:uncharacterized protein